MPAVPWPPPSASSGWLGTQRPPRCFLWVWSCHFSAKPSLPSEKKPWCLQLLKVPLDIWFQTLPAFSHLLFLIPLLYSALDTLARVHPWPHAHFWHRSPHGSAFPLPGKWSPQRSAITSLCLLSFSQIPSLRTTPPHRPPSLLKPPTLTQDTPDALILFHLFYVSIDSLPSKIWAIYVLRLCLSSISL